MVKVSYTGTIMVVNVSRKGIMMGKLKDKYLMNDTPPLNLSDLPDGTLIRITKYGSLVFHYFKEEGIWQIPGSLSYYHDSELNQYDEPVEVLYDPRKG
jgi:hypothetical protein